jgi:hypothetical protein
METGEKRPFDGENTSSDGNFGSLESNTLEFTKNESIKTFEMKLMPGLTNIIVN